MSDSARLAWWRVISISAASTWLWNCCQRPTLKNKTTQQLKKKNLARWRKHYLSSLCYGNSLNLPAQFWNCDLVWPLPLLFWEGLPCHKSMDIAARMGRLAKPEQTQPALIITGDHAGADAHAGELTIVWAFFLFHLQLIYKSCRYHWPAVMKELKKSCSHFLVTSAKSLRHRPHRFSRIK